MNSYIFNFFELETVAVFAFVLYLLILCLFQISFIIFQITNWNLDEIIQQIGKSTCTSIMCEYVFYGGDNNIL